TLFEGARHELPAVLEQAAAGTLEAFDLPGSLVLASRSRVEPIESFNVAGRLAGAEPRLASEHVVYSAHLDHVGIGVEIEGDG
ncbi:MAG TPA: hypothetical protein DDZ76_02375, partial [Xanthomonadales bacterium]|nr:hypothetical protein [Xanthomonadales bacterium]